MIFSAFLFFFDPSWSDDGEKLIAMLKKKKIIAQQNDRRTCVLSFICAVAVSLPLATFIHARVEATALSTIHQQTHHQLSSPATTATQFHAPSGVGGAEEPGASSMPAVGGLRSSPVVPPLTSVGPASGAERTFPRESTETRDNRGRTVAGARPAFVAETKEAPGVELWAARRAFGTRVDGSVVGSNWPLLPCGFDQHCPRAPIRTEPLRPSADLASLPRRSSRVAARPRSGGADSRERGGQGGNPGHGATRLDHAVSAASDFVFETSLAMLRRGGSGEQELRERRHPAYRHYEVGGKLGPAKERAQSRSGIMAGGRVAEGKCMDTLRPTATIQLHRVLESIRRRQQVRTQRRVKEEEKGTTVATSTPAATAATVVSLTRRHEADRKEASEAPEIFEDLESFVSFSITDATYGDSE